MDRGGAQLGHGELKDKGKRSRTVGSRVSSMVVGYVRCLALKLGASWELEMGSGEWAFTAMKKGGREGGRSTR